MKTIYRLMFKIVLPVVFLYMTAGCAGSLSVVKPESAGLSSEKLNRITESVAADIQSEKMPGAVVLVARHGKIAYFESFGLRDKDSKSAMQKDSIFRIYSMTKPVVTVGALMLVQEGKMSLSDPVSKFIPAFADLKVCEETKDASGTPICTEIPATRQMTILDLMRHTSGLTYGFLGKSATKSLYIKAGAEMPNQNLQDITAKLSKLPLAYQPGTTWEYSLSTDILGHIIEIVSGMPLDRFVEEKITRPLKMTDSAFYVQPDKLNRLAQGQKDPKTGKVPYLINVSTAPTWLSGGAGMVSTAADYARFLQMMLNKGQLDGVRLLEPKMIEQMTTNQLGPDIKPGLLYLPGAGYGYGMGVAVRLQDGKEPWPGSAGDYYWYGLAGTSFWVDPQKDLFVIFMIQEPGQRLYDRKILRHLVYPAILD
jgi:CubicO group peptidase (beta-lactamase class C family)